MNNTSILDTVLGNIDTKRAKNMERRMMLAVKIAEGIKINIVFLNHVF